MRRYSWWVIVLGMVLCMSGSYAAEFAGEDLKLYLDEPLTIPVNTPSRIAIGNPKIFDVGEVTKNALTLVPKAVGKTTLVFWDGAGEQAYQIKVFAENIGDIKMRVDSLIKKLDLPGVYTQAEEDEGRVYLLGKIKTPQDRERMQSALATLKDKIVDLVEVREEEAVVSIDAKVLELNKDAASTLGVTVPSTLNLTEVGSVGISAAGSKLSTLFKVVNLQRNTFSWGVEMLVQEGKARILSQPSLACQSGKEAELLVGGEKPIFTTEVASSGGEGTTVEYKEYGIKLKIKPTVMENDRIKIRVNVEISEVGTAETIGSNTTTTARAYPLSKRNASTELILDNGQTLAIGGLIKQKSAEDLRKIPYFGDIPILGMVFRKKTSTSGGGAGERGDTELFIFITPTIVTSGPAYETKNDTAIEVTPAPFVDEPVPLPASALNTSSAPSYTPAVDPVAEYSKLIQRRIMENLTYPPSAKEAGFKGVVTLRVRLMYTGKVQDVQVKGSSGFQTLDSNAVAAAERIASYPPFPPSITDEELWVEVPIVYQLE